MMDRDCVLIPLSKTGDNAGKFTAIVSPEDADLADLSWYVSHNTEGRSYAMRRTARNKRTYLHRVVLERMIGRPLEKHEQADHVDTNGLNCTRDNLRLATASQNGANRRQRSSKSGYKGVQYHRKGKWWEARITVKGTKLYLGHFDSPEKAYQAYCEAAIKYHGEFANFGDGGE